MPPFPPEKVALSPRHPLAQIHDGKTSIDTCTQKESGRIKCGTRRWGVDGCRRTAERNRKGEAEAEVSQPSLSALSCQAGSSDVTSHANTTKQKVWKVGDRSSRCFVSSIRSQVTGDAGLRVTANSGQKTTTADGTHFPQKWQWVNRLRSSAHRFYSFPPFQKKRNGSKLFQPAAVGEGKGSNPLARWHFSQWGATEQTAQLTEMFKKRRTQGWVHFPAVLAPLLQKEAEEPGPVNPRSTSRMRLSWIHSLLQRSSCSGCNSEEWISLGEVCIGTEKKKKSGQQEQTYHYTTLETGSPLRCPPSQTFNGYST